MQLSVRIQLIAPPPPPKNLGPLVPPTFKALEPPLMKDIIFITIYMMMHTRIENLKCLSKMFDKIKKEFCQRYISCSRYIMVWCYDINLRFNHKMCVKIVWKIGKVAIELISGKKNFILTVLVPGTRKGYSRALCSRCFNWNKR